MKASGDYLYGALDELRIYNHALSASEPAALTATPAPVSLSLRGPVSGAAYVNGLYTGKPAADSQANLTVSVR